MKTKLKPYPDCKCSGQEWLGRIPVHWDVLPNRALFQEIKDQNHPGERLLSVTISRGVIPQEVLLEDSSKKDSSNLEKSKYKLVQPGDIAYNKMRAWQGALGVAEHRGIVSPAYVVVRPRQEIDPRFYHYLLRTPAFITEAERWSYGITSDMWSLRHKDFKQIYCVLPPLNEQRKITRYLDQQNRHASRLIREKQRLIKLLNEQKQAVIQRAVTRGLDPDVPMKPSGVEWLGEVPEHWSLPRLKTITQATSGSTPTKSVEAYWNGDIPWVSPKDMKVDEIKTSIDRISAQALDETNIQLVEPGAVLIVVRGMILSRTLPVATNRVPVTINQDMKALRVQNEVMQADYLRTLLKGLSPYIVSLLVSSSGHGTKKLDSSAWGTLRVPTPPLEEQEKLLNEITERTSHLAALITRVSTEKDLIREYQTRLIADVVTGKLDVRNVDLSGLANDTMMDSELEKSPDKKEHIVEIGL